jgi:hypothetical protein
MPVLTTRPNTPSSNPKKAGIVWTKQVGQKSTKPSQFLRRIQNTEGNFKTAFGCNNWLGALIQGNLSTAAELGTLSRREECHSIQQSNVLGERRGPPRLSQPKGLGILCVIELMPSYPPSVLLHPDADKYLTWNLEAVRPFKSFKLLRDLCPRPLSISFV